MSRSASQTTTTAPAAPPSRYQAPRVGQALGAFTAGGARALDRTWGLLHTAVRGVFSGRCHHCGPAAPALGQRTARTPVSSGFRLDFCRSVRKPWKRALCLFPVRWLQPWLPFPFRRGSADPASPMLSRVYFTWPEAFWPSGGGTSQCPSPRKPPGSGNVFCEGPGSEYFSKISSKLPSQKVASRCLQTVYFFMILKKQNGIFKWDSLSFKSALPAESPVRSFLAAPLFGRGPYPVHVFVDPPSAPHCPGRPRCSRDERAPVTGLQAGQPVPGYLPRRRTGVGRNQRPAPGGGTDPDPSEEPPAHGRSPPSPREEPGPAQRPSPRLLRP